MTSLFCLRAFLAAALLPLSLVAGETPVAKTPAPALSLPLEPLGYRAVTSSLALRAGYTGATVHFIGGDHLLLTYTVKKLVKRSPEQRETDDDHYVRALVLHLPDGKVVRDAEWRLHDRGQYLWALSNGRFLLRVRNDLYSIDPLGSLDPQHMGQRLLLEGDREIVALELSPLHDVLLMETTAPRKIGDDETEAKAQQPVSAAFYRVETSAADGTVRLRTRGRAQSHHAFSISFTSMGALETVKEDRLHWGFDFHTFNGKNIELAGFTTTCRPTSVLVSDAEFFAFGCRGGADRRLMAGFNLLGEAKWVFTTDDEPLWLAVETSPETGRFAVRSMLTTVGMQGYDKPDADEVRGEEIRVYGSREGEELLRVTASPVQRPPGNFALSPDGLRLAVLQDAALNVFNLPVVSAADRKLHEKEQAALAPIRPAEDADISTSLSEPAEGQR